MLRNEHVHENTAPETRHPIKRRHAKRALKKLTAYPSLVPYLTANPKTLPTAVN
jgi:hypothetical protein